MKFSNIEVPARLFERTREHIRTLAHFTIDDIRTHLLTSCQAELAACNSIKQNWPLIANRVIRAVIVEMDDANKLAHIRRGVWARTRRLTNEESAIICTIHQEPRYRFLGQELRAARRMASAGYLQEGTDKRFTVTAAGEMAYKLPTAH